MLKGGCTNVQPLFVLSRMSYLLEIKMDVASRHDPNAWLRYASIIIVGLVEEVICLDIKIEFG